MHGPFRQYLYDLFNGKDTVWDENRYPIDTVPIGYGYNGNGTFRFVSDSLVTDNNNTLDSNTLKGLSKEDFLAQARKRFEATLAEK